MKCQQRKHSGECTVVLKPLKVYVGTKTETVVRGEPSAAERKIVEEITALNKKTVPADNGNVKGVLVNPNKLLKMLGA